VLIDAHYQNKELRLSLPVNSHCVELTH
jgi:hypothetical protein